MNFDILKDKDKEVYEALIKEKERQENCLELIASENFVSETVLEAVGSYNINKYSEGLPNKRYYAGCEHIDTIEQLAIDRACKLFNCNYANVQPHSGTNANIAVYNAILEYGDTILSMSLNSGSHLSHGAKPTLSGKNYNIINYEVNPVSYLIDYDEVERIAFEVKPKLIICGASAYPREIDFKRFGEIATKVGAYLMADVSHIAGLIVAGLHQSPFPYADIVTTTTHKTLRSARGAIILTNNEELIKKINKSVFPGIQGRSSSKYDSRKGSRFW